MVGIVVGLLETVALRGLVARNSHTQELARHGLGYVWPHAAPTANCYAVRLYFFYFSWTSLALVYNTDALLCSQATLFSISY